uniref:Uncharacterized protein n=1 Tax=Cucumis melo TaxID=3656 RepID=A0A9I9DAX6_CUCME
MTTRTSARKVNNDSGGQHGDKGQRVGNFISHSPSSSFFEVQQKCWEIMPSVDAISNASVL